MRSSRRLRSSSRSGSSSNSASSDRGASGLEYGLLIVAIAAVIVAVTFGLGSLLKSAFTQTTCQVNQSTSCSAP